MNMRINQHSTHPPLSALCDLRGKSSLPPLPNPTPALPLDNRLEFPVRRFQIIVDHPVSVFPLPPHFHLCIPDPSFDDLSRIFIPADQPFPQHLRRGWRDKHIHIRPLQEPPRRLRVYFSSPLVAGDLAITIDRGPFASIPFDFAPSGGAGVVQRTFDMPRGRHQVLATLHNDKGLTLGDQTFVLDFEPGHTVQLTVEMSGPRSVPRFKASEVR